jgi:DNA mismatch repair protein MSH5
VIDRFDPEARSDRSASSDNDQFRLPFLLDIRPPSEFYYEAAKNKLTTLSLGGDDSTQMKLSVPGDHLGHGHTDDGGTFRQQGQMLRLAGWIDMESRITVSRVRYLIPILTKSSDWVCWCTSIISAEKTCCYVLTRR